MIIQTPQLQDIINSFVENISATLPSLATTPNSVTREALINPASTQLSFIFDLAKRISAVQDIFEATGEDLDLLGSTYGLTRRTGTAATGTLYVDLAQLENVDVITISNGTLVRPRISGAQSSTFSIIGNFTFSSTDRAIFEANATSIREQLDAAGLSTVKLVAPVPIQATSVGTSGNVGAFTLSSAAIESVSTVINVSRTSGGTGSEDDDSFRIRIVAIFTGNSTGSEAGLLAAATTPSSITTGFVVKFGDPLMTRDGSVYDENGVLITAGHGRAVDIYVLGSSLDINSERLQFNLADTNNFLSPDNALLIGQPTEGATFGTLPIDSVTSLTSDESAASFTQATAVTDEEGNVLMEGNFALIKDIEADQFSIVENLVTRERKLAKFLNPTSTKYTTIETLQPSDFANSAFSNDKILFLKNTVEVQEEILTKGTFNGSDQLRFSNVTSLSEVFTEKTIRDTIKVENLIEVAGGFAITLKHTPVVSVRTVTNTRLGIAINFELVDAEQGLVRIISRAPPQRGDIILVDYIWKQAFTEDLNYELTGDLVNWIRSADEKNTIDNQLLVGDTIASEVTLTSQPNIPSYLEFEVGGLSDREIVETLVSGTAVNIQENHLTLKADAAFTFTVTGTSNVGRVFRATNVSQGFDYNLTGYKLSSNRLDPKARVDTSLLSQQFTLDQRSNIDLVSPGDRVVLSRPSRVLSWSTQADFENNIESNLAPIFDPTSLDFTAGGVILQTPLLDTATTPAVLGGFVTQNLVLSGIVEITEDLIITEGVVVDIEPNTTIKVRPTSQIQAQQLLNQRTTFDTNLLQSDTLGASPSAPYEEFFYLYFKPEGFPSNFFTIINDEGQTLAIAFESDILKKVVTDTGIEFFVGGRRINEAFNDEIESTLDFLDVTSSIKANLLGARSGVGGVAIFTSALVTINGSSTHYVLLDREPVLTNFLQNDFALNPTADSSITFTRFSYNDTINALLVDGAILEIDGYGDTTSATEYTVTYSIEERQRIAIIVEGTLRVVGATPQTSVLFTSGADSRTVGDWEGIIFTPKSHTDNPRTIATSDLSNARIMFGNVGLSIQSSDVNVENCVIRDCLSTGISMTSGNEIVSQFTETDFDITVIGDPVAKFSAEARLGYTTADDIRIARYALPDNLVTATGFLPSIGQKLTNTTYITKLVEGVDYTIFIDGQRVTSIDTTLPADGYADHSLKDGKDFVVEYDINNGYSLVFIYTAGSAKLRRVFDLVVDLEQNLTTGKITVDYFKSISNGLIFDNLIMNTDVGIIIDTLSTTSVNKNTIDNTRIGISATQAIASVRNNLITNYDAAALSIDNDSLLRAQRNDLYSSSIIEAEQRGLSDTDLLLRTIATTTTTLLVRTPSKFRVSSTIRIDEEEMVVQGVTDSSVIVARAQNGTSVATHEAGAQVELFQLNQIFTVTGLEADFCDLIETDIAGTQNPNSVPLSMRLVAPNTFRAAFPINRRADFYYKYRYGTRGSVVTNDTLVKTFPRDQFGVGVNDVVNILHEIPLQSVVFTPNNENYSADPLYRRISSSDYSFSPVTSLASRQNPVYGSLVAPQPNHRYVGFLDVVLSRNLGTGETRIIAPSSPLIFSSFDEITITGSDGVTQGINLRVKSFSFNITAAEADQGALGVFILDDVEHPTGVTVSGEYSVSYRTPTDLGSSIPPYYLESTIAYTVDLNGSTIFQELQFNKDDLGGEIEFTFQVADSIETLPSAVVSAPVTTSPISIEEVSATNLGKAIQINITLRGNDSSFTADSVFLFPILEDMSLSLTASKDVTEYKVLSLLRNVVQNETNILIDRPITLDTFNVVGDDDTLELFIRKKADNFDPAAEFLLTTTKAVTVGDTFITAKGDILTVKNDAESDDIIRVDYLSFADETETLFFTGNGKQITEKIFSSVSLVSNILTQDRQTVLPSTETMSIVGLGQPAQGDTYKTSYFFEAPLNGETVVVGYNYNAAISDASLVVEDSKSIFTDVLVKEVKDTPVRVALALEVTPTAPALSVQSEVSQAIAEFFESTLSDIESERRVDTSDLIRATGDIEGIETIEVTTLSKTLVTGEIETPLIFTARESASLEDGSPRINTVQNGRPIVLGSS